MRSFLMLALFFLMSCDQNPFGESSISSCDHAPNAKVGLPAVCQVSLSDTNDLALWIDPNDNSTLIASNSEITTLLDKSGNGNNLIFGTGVKASLNNGSTNERDSLLFGNASGNYAKAGDFASAVPANSDVSVFFVFRVRESADDNILITNGADFSLELNSEGRVEYKIGTGNTQITDVQLLSSLLKVSFVFNATSGLAELFVNQDKISEGIFTVSSTEWLGFNLSGQAQSELMELLIYSDQKTATERNEIESYLNNKWGF